MSSTGAALPQLDFGTFVMSLASSALMHLGELPHADSEKPEPNLALAKQTIDLLGLLQDKTRGNLTDEEGQLLQNLLYDLRMRYVAHTKTP